jgi:hypothetical protein
MDDTAELIKWWDVLYDLASKRDIAAEVEKARACRHPDAQWLASLVPAGESVTRGRLHDVMLKHGEDPRAKHIMHIVAHPSDSRQLLQRSAKMGYAPAQGTLALRLRHAGKADEQFLWAQRAAAQGERCGLYVLALCYWNGQGCEKDTRRAIELFRKAAELGFPPAFWHYGEVSCGGWDWERYYWHGRAASRRYADDRFCGNVSSLLPLFEKRQRGRVLHTAAAVIRANYVPAERRVFGRIVDSEERDKLNRLFELHDEMLSRARDAIDCWSVVGLRRGMVKDMRVMIAKMAWEEPWRWSDKEVGEEQRDETAKLG